jgi:hypothetical protein
MSDEPLPPVVPFLAGRLLVAANDTREFLTIKNVLPAPPDEIVVTFVSGLKLLVKISVLEPGVADVPSS